MTNEIVKSGSRLGRLGVDLLLELLELLELLGPFALLELLELRLFCCIENISFLELKTLVIYYRYIIFYFS